MPREAFGAKREEVAGHYRALQDTTGHFRTLQGTAGHYRALKDTTGHFMTLQGTEGHYRAPQDTAGHYRALQDTTQREASGFALPNGQINSKTGGEWGELGKNKMHRWVW